MKINQIINETTTAGAISSIAQPMGAVKTRSGKKAGSMFKGKTTNKPFYEDQVNEEDKIIAPGKGTKYKPGLLNKPEQSMNPTDSVKVDVPLLIRLLEYAREDANSDLDLHDLAEKLVARGTRGKTLTMKDYEYVVDECMSGGVVAGGGVGEGLGDTIKKGVKSVKRGMQGWGVGASPEMIAPSGVVSGIKNADDETLMRLVKGQAHQNKGKAPAAHSPQELGQRVIGRELSKRGLGEVSQDTARSYAQKASASQKDLINQTHRKGADTDKLNKKIQNRQQGLNRAHTDKRYYKDELGEGEKVDRMVKHIAKSETKLGHSKKEAENIAWATANKRGMLDNKNKKK